MLQCFESITSRINNDFFSFLTVSALQKLQKDRRKWESKWDGMKEREERERERERYRESKVIYIYIILTTTRVELMFGIIFHLGFSLIRCLEQSLWLHNGSWYSKTSCDCDGYIFIAMLSAPKMFENTQFWAPLLRYRQVPRCLRIPVLNCANVRSPAV